MRKQGLAVLAVEFADRSLLIRIPVAVRFFIDKGVHAVCICHVAAAGIVYEPRDDKFKVFIHNGVILRVVIPRVWFTVFICIGVGMRKAGLQKVCS